MHYKYETYERNKYVYLKRNKLRVEVFYTHLTFNVQKTQYTP